jgi:MerR family transcriptional regulator, heat shock protein HspR
LWHPPPDFEAGAKNRLYSESDIERVRRIQRLTQEMGVNLAGVELILKLLEDMEEMRSDLERQMAEYMREAERRIQEMLANPTVPVRKGETLLPVPNLKVKKSVEL